MDVFPTLLRLADGELPNDAPVDGVDVLPMAMGHAASPHQRLFWEYNGQRAVREGKWKLVVNGKLDFTRTQPDAVHLSDIEADPGERTNLSEREPEVVARLTEALHHWARSTASRS